MVPDLVMIQNRLFELGAELAKHIGLRTLRHILPADTSLIPTFVIARYANPLDGMLDAFWSPRQKQADRANAVIAQQMKGSHGNDQSHGNYSLNKDDHSA